jgi:hypothetical protein
MVFFGMVLLMCSGIQRVNLSRRCLKSELRENLTGLAHLLL